LKLKELYCTSQTITHLLTLKGCSEWRNCPDAHLLSYIANKLDLEVVLANPLDGIEISPKIGKKKAGIAG
jgi:hypothetical protein